MNRTLKLLIIMLAYVQICSAQDVKVEFSRVSRSTYCSSQGCLYSHSDTLEKNTIFFSNKKNIYTVNRHGDGEQFYDSIRYEYKENDTLIRRRFTPVYFTESNPWKFIDYSESVVDTFPLQENSVRLFEYDKFSLLKLYEHPYEFLSDSEPNELIIVDTILENDMYNKNDHSWLGTKNEHIISETRFFKCNQRAWLSLCWYGVTSNSKFLAFSYTTVNRQLVSDCFITNEYCIKRVFLYDTYNRLVCVSISRTNILGTDELVEWNDTFVYEEP